MAIGTPVNRGTASGTTTATTASFTPGAGDILYALAFGRRNTSPSVKPVVSDSIGGTWTEIVDGTYDTGTNPRLRGTWYRSTATGAAMTVTGAISDGTTTGIMVCSVSGADTDISNFGSNTNATGDPSVTLTAPAATSAVIGVTFQNATNGIAPVGTYTELVEFTANAAMQGECCYDISSPAATVSWTSTNTFSVGFAVEVKEASSSITATAAITQAADTTSSTVDNAITATAATTQSADTVSSDVAVGNETAFQPAAFQFDAFQDFSIYADVAVTQAADTVSSTVSNPITATVATTQAADTVSSTASNAIDATAAITQAADTVSSTASNPITITAAIVQAADTASSTASNPITSTAAITQAADTVSATASNSSGTPIDADAAIVQAADTTSSTVVLATSASADILQAADTVSSTMTAVTFASVAALQAADTTTSSTFIAFYEEGDADFMYVYSEGQHITLLPAMDRIIVAPTYGMSTVPSEVQELDVNPATLRRYGP